MEYARKYLDYCESVAEELIMNGFDVRVVKGSGGGWFIEYDTIAGRMKYSCSENTVMADYYRFINHYGSKLSKWGLDKKLETYNNKMEHNKELKQDKQCDIHVVSSSYRKCKSCDCNVEVTKDEANLIDKGTMLCTCDKPKCLDFGLIELGFPLGFGSN